MIKREVNIVVIGNLQEIEPLRRELVNRGYSVSLLTGGESPRDAADLILTATQGIVIVGAPELSIVVHSQEGANALARAKQEKPSIFVPHISGSIASLVDKIEVSLYKRSFSYVKDISDVSSRLEELKQSDQNTRDEIANIVYNAGCFLLEDGKPDEAIEAFLLSTELNPKMVHAHYNLAQEYLKKEDGVSAINELKKVVDISPDDLETRIQLGDVYCLNHQYKEAIEQYRYVSLQESEFRTEVSVKLKSLWRLIKNLRVEVNVAEIESGKQYEGYVKLDEYGFEFELVFGVPLGRLNDYAGARIGQFWEKVQVVIRDEHSRPVELNDKSKSLFLRTGGVAAMQIYRDPMLVAQQEEFLEKLRRQNPTNPIDKGGAFVTFNYELPRTPEIDSALTEILSQSLDKKHSDQIKGENKNGDFTKAFWN